METKTQASKSRVGTNTKPTLRARARTKLAQVAGKATTAAQRKLGARGHRLQEVARKAAHVTEELATRVIHSAQETKQKAKHRASEVTARADHRRLELTDKLKGK